MTRSRPSSTLRVRFAATAAVSAFGGLLTLFAALALADSAGFDFSALPTSTFALLAFILAIGAGVVGMASGLAASDRVARSARAFLDHIRSRGNAALEGEPYETPLDVDPHLPFEMRELGTVIDDLLRQLSAHTAELRRATDLAWQAEESLAVAVENLPDGIALLRDGIVVLANPAVCYLIGRPADDIVGRSLEAVLADADFFGEDGEALSPSELLERALRRPIDVRITLPGLADRWVSLAARRPGGHPRHVVLTARDVAEERRRSDLRGEILSLVSHDLRTPLTVITGYIDLLERPLDPDARTHAAEGARRSSVRMLELLEDLLRATRADEVFAPRTLSPVDLTALADEMTASLATTGTQRLAVRAAGSVVVLGDPHRLRQALSNLITNAFKYTPPASVITIAVGRKDGRATIAVEDEGPGIPENARTTVFDRLKRLEGGDVPGTGLGLYIVQSIAEGHGGSARVEDAPSGGARVVIDLPLATDAVSDA